MTDKQEPSFTQADLQHAVRDLNDVFGTKQKHVAKKEQIIDFIVATVGNAFGPDPENPEQSIWVHGMEKNPSPQTVATYEALIKLGFGPKAEPEPTAAPAELELQPETSAAATEPEATSSAEPEPAPDAGEPQGCPDFGKPLNKKKDEGYNPDSPECRDQCNREAECRAAAAEAAKPKTQTGGSKGPSARGTMLDLLCATPTMTKEELGRAVEAAGFKVDKDYKKATLDTTFSDCQQVFKRLREAGHLA